jgi:hypothetical protein
LNDVAIINDTLAYAVGEFYVKDTATGQVDPNAYNAVKWDGKKWQLWRIPFIGSCSAVLFPPLRAVWAFSPTNILFSNGGSIVRYDGTNAVMDCGMNTLLVGAITKIFATSPQDIYAVGGSGSIVHYTGSSWTKLESGTTMTLRDIWGAKLPNSDEYEIITVGNNWPQGSDRIILQITGNSAKTLNDAPLQYPTDGIWFAPRRQYYLAGGGIYQKRLLGDNMWKNDPLQLTTFYTSSVRGTNINNILIAGHFGELLHYNGMTWKSYRLEIFPQTDIYENLDVRDKLTTIVGTLGLKSVITVGRQQ